MTVTSKDNKTCRLIRSLKLKKNRDLTGLFVAEGQRIVKDIVSLRPDLVETVAVREDRAGFAENETVIKTEIFASLAETENSQGIIAVVRIPKEQPVSSPYILLLDGISDPGNLGTLIRTALAAGYHDVILKGCCDPYSGKAVRSTMSAVTGVNIVRYSEKGMENIKKLGYNIICADMDGEDVFSLGTLDRICLVIGSEAEGVSDEIRNECGMTVKIPMEKGIESLNAAVSGGILMYNLKYGRN